jgi:hypothetical protein
MGFMVKLFGIVGAALALWLVAMMARPARITEPTWWLGTAVAFIFIVFPGSLLGAAFGEALRDWLETWSISPGLALAKIWRQVTNLLDTLLLLEMFLVGVMLFILRLVPLFMAVAPKSRLSKLLSRLELWFDQKLPGNSALINLARIGVLAAAGAAAKWSIISPAADYDVATFTLANFVIFSAPAAGAFYWTIGREKRSKCPECDSTLGVYYYSQDSDGSVFRKLGDFGPCRHCFSGLIYDDRLNLRKLREADLENISRKANAGPRKVINYLLVKESPEEKTEAPFSAGFIEAITREVSHEDIDEAIEEAIAVVRRRSVREAPSFAGAWANLPFESRRRALLVACSDVSDEDKFKFLQSVAPKLLGAPRILRYD